MLSIVVPVYNEENGITPFLLRTEKVVEDLDCNYEIIFCMDPSTDHTYEVIKEHMTLNKNIKLITMSRRFRQAAATINRANTYSTILQYATLDALTNLNNRRQFETRLGQEISIAKRQNNPLCAMMIDIDFFKRVNDTYGHAAGDEVLRTVAGIIKDTLRESDIPSRYGGEEFAVLLPFTKLEEARIVGERLRAAVESAPIPINQDSLDAQTINVTISMGLAEYDKQETGEVLFERADKALYEAKTGGRNRVCVTEN